MCNQQYENTLLGNSVHVKHVMETDVLNHRPSDEHKTFYSSTRLYPALSSTQNKNTHTQSAAQKERQRLTFCSGNEEDCTNLITPSLKTENHIFPLIQITNHVICSSTCH